jgi:hypothetical protein
MQDRCLFAPMRHADRFKNSDVSQGGAARMAGTSPAMTADV